MTQEQPELPPGPARDLVDLFRVLPRARSLSGHQLAQAASVSDSYVSEIRRGLRTPACLAWRRDPTATRRRG